MTETHGVKMTAVEHDQWIDAAPYLAVKTALRALAHILPCQKAMRRDKPSLVDFRKIYYRRLDRISP